MLCSDGSSVVLECDECDSVWIDPFRFGEEHAWHPEDPECEIPIEGCTMKRPATRPASRTEIEQAGFGTLIAGTSKPLWSNE